MAYMYMFDPRWPLYSLFHMNTFNIVWPWHIPILTVFDLGAFMYIFDHRWPLGVVLHVHIQHHVILADCRALMTLTQICIWWLVIDSFSYMCSVTTCDLGACVCAFDDLCKKSSFTCTYLHTRFSWHLHFQSLYMCDLRWPFNSHLSYIATVYSLFTFDPRVSPK